MEALAAAAISIAGPYIAMGAEEFVKQAGQDAFGAVKALADRLHRWWLGEPVAAAAAERLASDPKRYSTILAQLLATDLTNDEGFASELRELVGDVGPHVEVVQGMEIADGVTGADVEELVRGSVHIEQQMKEARNVTGYKGKRIGG
jgi:hypothetical protein